VLCLGFGGSIVAMLLIAVIAVLAVLVGVSLGYWIRNLSVRSEISALTQNGGNLAAQLADREGSLEQARNEAMGLREAKARLEAENSQIAGLRASLQDEITDRQNAHRQVADLRERTAQLATQLENERYAAKEKLELLVSARQELSNQFKSLAGDILKENSKSFTDQNKTNLDYLLNPIKEKFGEFQKTVADLQNDSITGRTALKVQIDQLLSLNQRLSQDATNLVQALKGSSKTQGDWGELLLEQLLEAAGLRKGQEYRTQETFSREDNKRARVDVILSLPEGRQLIIDSKVSLNDYDDYCGSEDEVARESALKRHIASMRSHIKTLSQQNYQALYGLNSIDFVIMFVPIEPAFMLAMANEGKLWQEGWDKNVLLVSRTTLLFVLRTVAHLWRQEQQTRNVQEIVRRGGDLYEKLAAFTNDLLDVGKSLENARQSYDEAVKKLSTGKGNVIRRAEMLLNLGIKPAKKIPPMLVEAALDMPAELADPLFDNPEVVDEEE
jgi:DNA recombination protein RmuC